MSLWQKESNKPGALYVDIFKNMKVDHPDEVKTMDELSGLLEKIASVQRAPKSDSHASGFRSQGNVKFRNKNWIEAMNLYNKSLLFAPMGSENVSLAYANRSACFLKLKRYNECLADIELAKQANYPQRLMEKLEQRREDCMKAREPIALSVYDVPKLSYEADTNFPGMASVTKINYNAEYGRHYVATSDIPAGKIILVEDAFTSRKRKPKHGSCTICMKRFANVIACDNCSEAMFCTNCIDKKSFHNLECNNWVDTHSAAELIARMISWALDAWSDVDSWMDFVEKAVTDNVQAVPDPFKDTMSKYHAFLQLNICLSTKRYNEDIVPAYKGYRIISAYKTLQGVFDTEKKKRFFMHLIFHHVMTLGSNGFKEQENDKWNTKSVFILQSYFNHSCAPNVLLVDYGNRSCFSTVRPVKKGQQLFLSYSGDFSGRKSEAYYQKYLYETFGFRCKCERCEPEKDALKASEFIVKMDPEYQYLCDTISNQTDSTFHKKTAAATQKMCIELFNRFGHMHWCPAMGYIIHGYAETANEFCIF